MALDVPVALERPLRFAAAPAAAFALLADVPRWADWFPHAEAVEPAPDLGPGVYRWTLEPLGPPGYAVRTTYACRYEADPAARTLVWTPVPGVGNARVEGAVRLWPDGEGAAGSLRLAMTLALPAVPRLARALVVPAVRAGFGRMTDAFVARVAAALKGAEGRSPSL